jgi:hypothetical protein
MMDFQAPREAFRFLARVHQNIIFFYLFFFDSFAFLDANPDSEFGSGSTDPIESGSETMELVI